MRTMMIAMMVLILLMLSLRYCPESLIIGYALTGHSPLCSTAQTFRGAQASFRYHRILSTSRKSCWLAGNDPLGFHNWRTSEGNYWIPAGSDEVLPVLIAQQRSNIYGTGSLGVQRGDVVLDCGAHIGVFTRKALQQGASRVIAIEPGPENLECLRRNLKDEIGQGLVTVRSEGVWDVQTSLQFNRFDRNSAADSFVMGGSPSTSALLVQVTTIDQLVSDLGLTRVDFIKLDVKGSAERALKGAKKTLARYKPRLAISTEEIEDNPERVISLCRSLQPAYTIDCGLCAIADKYVLPMVVFFH